MAKYTGYRAKVIYLRDIWREVHDGVRNEAEKLVGPHKNKLSALIAIEWVAITMLLVVTVNAVMLTDVVCKAPSFLNVLVLMVGVFQVLFVPLLVYIVDEANHHLVQL